ncbi:ATP-dependent DNA helicase [Raphanus sativus]|nr:ATP-dependent DNA helicase [Raphanus sativus]
MKRKRKGVHGQGKENLPTNSTSGIRRSPAASVPIPVGSGSTMPLTSVFHRVYQNIESSQSATTHNALNVAHGPNLASPQTPATAPVSLMLKVSLISIVVLKKVQTLKMKQIY